MNLNLIDSVIIVARGSRLGLLVGLSVGSRGLFFRFFQKNVSFIRRQSLAVMENKVARGRVFPSCIDRVFQLFASRLIGNTNSTNPTRFKRVVVSRDLGPTFLLSNFKHH